MGDRDQSVMAARQEHARRAKEMTIIHGVMVCLLFLLVIQFLLLVVSLESFLAGQGRIALPAALGSAGCFAAAIWLGKGMNRKRVSGPT